MDLAAFHIPARNELERSNGYEEKSVSGILWDFPLAAPPICDGDPDAFSMQFAAVHEERAAQQFLRDQNSVLSGLLCIRTLQLDIANGQILELQASLAAVEEKLQQCKDREEEQDKLAKDIWTTRGRKDPDGSWDPQPVLLDSPVLRSSTAPPVTLSQVLRGLNLHYDTAVMRKLACTVLEAYKRTYGVTPRPTVYYDDDGHVERLGCYTEDDRDFIEDVVLEFDSSYRRTEALKEQGC